VSCQRSIADPVLAMMSGSVPGVASDGAFTGPGFYRGRAVEASGYAASGYEEHISFIRPEA
jgi:hypothetical protein